MSRRRLPSSPFQGRPALGIQKWTQGMNGPIQGKQGYVTVIDDAAAYKYPPFFYRKDNFYGRRTTTNRVEIGFPDKFFKETKFLHLGIRSMIPNVRINTERKTSKLILRKRLSDDAIRALIDYLTELFPHQQN